MEHYLLTMNVVHDQLRMHGYLMTNDKQVLMRACDKLGYEAEKLAEKLGVRLLPLMLTTGPLSARGKKVVREIICQQAPQVKELLRKARKFHFTLLVCTPNNPNDARLMALH